VKHIAIGERLERLGTRQATLLLQEQHH